MVKMNSSGYEEKIENIFLATASVQPQDRSIKSESSKHMLVPYHTKNYYILQT
jgi:hypothetical protein